MPGADRPAGGDDRLWYAGYGSNLDAARMATYLVGGLARGSRRANPGSREPALPAEVRTCEVPGRLRFGGRFDTWGEGGGAAFFERSDDPRDRVVCRAYRLTVTQIVDVVVQENGVAPVAAAAGLLDGIASSLRGLPAGRPARLDLRDHGLDPYDLIEWSPATTLPGGEAIDVVLLGRAEPLPHAPPPPEYRDTILRGLVDAGLSERDADRYLAGFVGGAGER